MARTPKPSGRLDRGPWTGDHCLRIFERAGWQRVSTEGSHAHLSHPTRSGKITVDLNWTSIKVGHDAWRSWLATGGYSRRELLKLFN